MSHPGATVRAHHDQITFVFFGDANNFRNRITHFETMIDLNHAARSLNLPQMVHDQLPNASRRGMKHNTARRNQWQFRDM
jgi:hypothetical protein